MRKRSFQNCERRSGAGAVVGLDGYGKNVVLSSIYRRYLKNTRYFKMRTSAIYFYLLLLIMYSCVSSIKQNTQTERMLQ